MVQASGCSKPLLTRRGWFSTTGNNETAELTSSGALTSKGVVFKENSWVTFKGLDSMITVESGQFLGKDFFERYIWSLFMSGSQMLCIGYGQFPPSEISEMGWILVGTVVGSIIWSVVIGDMTSMVLDDFV